MRKDNLVKGEIYHIYNRGVDKRNIVMDKEDMDRFFQSMIEFNTITPIGSIYENSFIKKNGQLGRLTSKLVEIVAYCLNPNHFHLLLKQETDSGISEFMKRLGGGYTKYFNTKYGRSGALFQGTFLSKHIDSNEYLLRVSSYVNLNNQIKGRPSFLSMASWREYLEDDAESLCSSSQKDLILGQFKGVSEYKRFALEALEDIKFQKNKNKDQEEFFT